MMTLPMRRSSLATPPAVLAGAILLLSAATLTNRTLTAGGIIWSGGGAGDDWTDIDNWTGGVVPVALDSVIFDLVGGDTVNHDAPAGTVYGSFTFDAGAGPFVIDGNSIAFVDGGGITSLSTDLQTFNVDIAGEGDLLITSALGDLLFTGELSVLEDFNIIFDVGETVTLSGFISGAGGVQISGGGTVIMDGAGENTYTGATEVSDATLILSMAPGNAGNDFGSAIQGDLTISGGGTVQLGDDHQISDNTTITFNNGTLDLDVYEDAVAQIVFLGGGSIIGDAAGNGIGLTSSAGIRTEVVGGAEISANLFLTSADSADTDTRIFEVAGGAPLTISGIISDGTSGEAGSFEKTGSGTLTLTGANTYSGGTFLSAGTLFGNNASALGTGNVTITGGTLRGFSDIGGDLIQSGGEFRPDNASNVTIGGTYQLLGGGFTPKEDLSLNITGDLLIDGGSFESGGVTDVNIGGDFNLLSGALISEGTLNLDVAGDLLIEGGNFAPTGSLNALIAGNFRLLGGTFAPTDDATLEVTGDVTLDGGDFTPTSLMNASIGGNFDLLSGTFGPTGDLTLDIAGNLNIDGGDFRVDPSAVLVIGGDIQLRDGLFAIEGGPSETEIGGEFHLDGGTWQVVINDAGAASLIIADTATLLSGTIVAAPLDPITLVRNYLILSTAGGIIGDPDDIDRLITDESFLLDFRLVLDGDDLILRAIPGATFADAAATSDNPNLAGIAAALDPALQDGLGGSTMASLQMLSQEDLVRTLEQFQPQIYQATTTVLRRQQRLINATRMGRFSHNRGRLLEYDRAVRRSALAFAGDNDDAAVAAAVAAVHGTRNPVGTWSAWARSLNDIGRWDGDRAAKAFSWHSHGLDAGAEYMVSRELTIGGSISGLWSRIRGREGSGSGDSVSLFGNISASWSGGPWYVDGGLSYGHAWNDTKRPMALLNLSADQEYESDLYGAFVGAGWVFDAGDFTFEPYTSLEYGHIRDKGFTETLPDGFGQRVSSERTDSLRQSLGVRAGYTFESVQGHRVRPRANFAWEYEYMDREVGRSSALFGNSFRTRGQRPGRTGVNLGLGVDWFLRSNLAIVADYALSASNASRIHTINAGLRWEF